MKKRKTDGISFANTELVFKIEKENQAANWMLIPNLFSKYRKKNRQQISCC
jgi:hypothetical protein